MRRSRLFHLTVLVAFVLVGALSWARPASAQCAIPAGWQPYTVVRGDNLYRISLRFGTSIAALQSGNCLSTTRIFAGQRLYVPSGGTQNPTPLPNNPATWRSALATFQQYEKGFMIWRADTGDIWVYVSGSRNRLNVHPSGAYGGLPDNTIPPPTGFVQPIMGFGKVWRNLNNYSSALGWATRPEVSFTLQFGVLNGQMVEFRLPDGSAIVRYADGFWSAFGGTSAGAASVTIQMPATGATLAAGVPFNAAGQAVGVFEASFVLDLRETPTGTVLSSQIITYTTADFGVTAPWQAVVTPINFAGEAELRALYTRPSDGVQVVLASVPVSFR